MKNFALIAAIALPLAACNSNTAPGNDREAQRDPPATAAPIEDAASCTGKCQSRPDASRNHE